MRFDPDDPVFADVPLVHWDGATLTVVRGEVPADRHLETLEAAAGAAVPDGGPYGVFLSEVSVELVEAGGDAPSPNSAVVDVAEQLDGVSTLAELRARLHTLAARLERAEVAGWQISSPMSDAAVVLRRDDPPR